MPFSSGSLRGLCCKGLVLCCGGLALGQPLPTPAHVFGEAATAWQRTELVRMIAAMLPALVAVDRPVAGLEMSSPAADVVFGVARLYGERWTPLLLAAGLYGAGWVLGEQRLRQAGIAVVSGAGFTALLVVGLKVALGRARPRVSAASLVFRAPGWDDAYQSFPSGHSALAFLMSSVVASTLELPSYAQGALYGVATLTALSRLYHHQHWLSDVVAGALIGWTVGQATAGVLGRAQHTARYELFPVPNGVGVRVPLR